MVIARKDGLALSEHENPIADTAVSYLRSGDLVSIHLQGLSDMELHQVILGLWTKLSRVAQDEVIEDMVNAAQGVYVPSPIVSAFKESTGKYEAIDLNKFIPRGGDRGS